MFAFFGFNDDAVDTYRGILVRCGAGRVWPRLKMSREQRRASETMVNNTMDSRGSFKSQFDIVGKAMKYFDAGAKKDSHATGVTLVDGYVLFFLSRPCPFYPLPFSTLLLSLE